MSHKKDMAKHSVTFDTNDALTTHVSFSLLQDYNKPLATNCPAHSIIPRKCIDF